MPRNGNLQDIWNKLDEILTQLGGVGGDDLATEPKQDDIIAELTGSQRVISAVEITTAGVTTAGLQSVSLLFDGNGGTLNGVSVPNRYMASFSPNGINDTLDSVSYTPPTTGAGRIIITSVA
jgi:hypothetical protein